MSATSHPNDALWDASAPLWLADAERWLRRIVEIPAALLVAAEVLILFIGICARSFHQPIIWSDELASILFLWLGMLGAVVAIQRGEHMRLTFLVSMFSRRTQVWCETLAVGGVFVLLALLMHAAYDYTQDQSFVEMPALGWPGTVRALAVPVGFALALLSCSLKLLRHGWGDVVGVGLLLVLIAAGFYTTAPYLAGIGNWALLVFFRGPAGGGVLAGVPIAFSFALATTSYLLTVTTTPSPSWSAAWTRV